MNDLPSDLLTFLKNADSPIIAMKEGEVRNAVMMPIGELSLQRFRVVSEDDDADGGDEVAEEFEGYSLLKTADGYDPFGVLLWLPALNSYGAWDGDHHKLIAFPGVTWTDIALDPTWYINGQWYPERVAHKCVIPKKQG